MKGATGRLSAMGIIVLFTGCSPVVHKQEVAEFSASLTQAVDAFEALRADEQRRVQASHEEDLAKQKAIIDVSLECADTILERLRVDTQCMADWSFYRGNPQTEMPECKEPAIDSQTGKVDFYDMKSLVTEEKAACALGLRAGDSDIVDPRALEKRETLRNARILTQQLVAYADALAMLTDATDVDNLQSAIADSQSAVESLHQSVNQFSKGTDRTSEISAVGGLVGSVMVAVLERRRYNALKEVVLGANETVQNAARHLSRFSASLMLHDLTDKGENLIDKVTRFNDVKALEAEDWKSALADAREAHEAYETLLDNNLSETFIAMAETHQALVDSLQDTNRQLLHLKERSLEFADRAATAKEVFGTP